MNDRVKAVFGVFVFHVAEMMESVIHAILLCGVIRLIYAV